VRATVEGISTREPAFGLPAVWIAQDRRDQAINAGYTVVDPTTAISTHLSEIIRSFLPDLLTRQHTKELIDRLGQTSAKLVEEIVPKVCSVGEVQRVLRQLLRERVPVRDLTTILEAMADAASVSKDPDVIIEAVRTALGRAVCRSYQADNGDLKVIALSPAPTGEPSWPWTRTGLSDWPVAWEKSWHAMKWHSLCFFAPRRFVRTSGGCSHARFRTSLCCRTRRCRRR
jgi:flagellar biosynthesis protein FlhA